MISVMDRVNRISVGRVLVMMDRVGRGSVTYRVGSFSVIDRVGRISVTDRM